jgi:hypothetical protein
MEKISCCICSGDSTVHVFRKHDTYQLMKNLTIANYTGGSYCEKCWADIRDYIDQKLNERVAARG